MDVIPLRVKTAEYNQVLAHRIKPTPNGRQRCGTFIRRNALLENVVGDLHQHADGRPTRNRVSRGEQEFGSISRPNAMEPSRSPSLALSFAVSVPTNRQCGLPCRSEGFAASSKQFETCCSSLSGLVGKDDAASQSRRAPCKIVTDALTPVQRFGGLLIGGLRCQPNDVLAVVHVSIVSLLVKHDCHIACCTTRLLDPGSRHRLRSRSLHPY